jgi:hypothetical protein
MPVSLGELAVRFGCELRGDPDRRIERVATLAGADALPRAAGGHACRGGDRQRRSGGRLSDRSAAE